MDRHGAGPAGYSDSVAGSNPPLISIFFYQLHRLGQEHSLTIVWVLHDLNQVAAFSVTFIASMHRFSRLLMRSSRRYGVAKNGLESSLRSI